MFRNYLRNAFRYLSKHPLTTAINILGLGLGICVCFLALLFIDFELGYDAYHQDAERIYRLVTDINTPTDTYYESTSAPMMPAVLENFPEIETATRLLPDYLIVQKEDGSIFGEENIAYADSTFFSIFTFPLISGDSSKALQNPLSIVLSETAAQKYFGTTDCLGQILLLGDAPAQVTGIMRDMPHNIHFRVDILVSMATLLNAWNPAMNRQWQRFGFYTYLKLHPQPDVASLESKVTEHLSRQMGKDEEAQYVFQLERLERIYLQGKARGSRYGTVATGSMQQIYVFSAVAVFVLFIACFNFINLSTAMSVQRAGEIGIRKVMGASRRQLIFQFLADSLLLSLLAMVLAILLSVIFLPTFNQLTGKVIRLQLFEHGTEAGGLLLGTLVVGLLSGLYPAFFLSAFPSIHQLKGKVLPRRRENLLSKGLIIGQFVISFFLLSATLIVYQQLQYMQHKELGYDQEQKLVLDFHYDHHLVNRQEALKQQLLAVHGVEGATFSSSLPGRANRRYETAIENADKRMSEFQSDVYFVDHDFVEQYQINLLAGRLFSEERATDSTEAMLVNEAAVRSLGYHDPEEIIGKRFEQQGRSGTIVGVVRDFHFHSFREGIRPLTLRISPGWNLYTFITLDLTTDELPATLNKLEQLWSSVAPGKPFLYFFADEAFQAQYLAEQRFASLFSYLALVAILISSLGLLGLAAFNTKLRFREIGIRKVLGASLPGLLLLLGGNYLRLILIALVIAIPLTNYFMSEWLTAFAYRVELMWWFFALPAALLLVIALLTISSQTVRAAQQNPVDSLRDE